MTTDNARGSLSPREIEVLQLLCAGRTHAEIAIALSISSRTVDSHRTHLTEKSGCENGIALGAWAERHGYLRGVHVGVGDM